MISSHLLSGFSLLLMAQNVAGGASYSDYTQDVLLWGVKVICNATHIDYELRKNMTNGHDNTDMLAVVKTRESDNCDPVEETSEHRRWVVPLIDDYCGMAYYEYTKINKKDNTLQRVHEWTFGTSGGNMAPWVWCQTQNGPVKVEQPSISLETMQTAQIIDPKWEQDTVGLQLMSTVGVVFKTHPTLEKNIDMYPYRCWIKYEDEYGRKISNEVVTQGCPSPSMKKSDGTQLLQMGQRFSNAVSGANCSLFFNAEPTLLGLPDDYRSPMPRFHFECEMFPCAATNYRGVQGLDMCPSVALCDVEDKKPEGDRRPVLPTTPRQIFRVKQNFSVRINMDDEMKGDMQRVLIGPMYMHWFADYDVQNPKKVVTVEIWQPLIGAVIFLSIIICFAVFVQGRLSQCREAKLAECRSSIAIDINNVTSSKAVPLIQASDDCQV